MNEEGKKVDEFLKKESKSLTVEQWLVNEPLREPLLFKFAKLAKQA